MNRYVFGSSESAVVDLKRTTIDVGGIECEVFYLLAHTDETSASDPYA
jgi:hypothetical protein